MGPHLLGRLLEINDTQQGVLEVVFQCADDEGMLLLDLRDLRAMLSFASDNAKVISKQYGLISPASLAAIQRSLLSLEQSGADHFFGEPALELADFMRQDMSGRGIINVLSADQLILKPKLYSAFLLWMLSELFESLPEMGDLDKPRLVFFFDEAHLLFDDAPAALLQRVEQVVRLIRSKGVGVYFCSQNPTMCRRKSSGRWEIASSMPCAHSLHAIKRPCGERRRLFRQIRRSTWLPRLPNWPLAKPW